MRGAAERGSLMAPPQVPNWFDSSSNFPLTPGEKHRASGICSGQFWGVNDFYKLGRILQVMLNPPNFWPLLQKEREGKEVELRGKLG